MSERIRIQCMENKVTQQLNVTLTDCSHVNGEDEDRCVVVALYRFCQVDDATVLPSNHRRLGVNHFS